MIQVIKILLGLDKEWEDAFDATTLIQIDSLSEKYVKRGIWGSGIAKKAVNLLELKRKQEKRDEARKRLLEGLSVIPGWLALLISILALLLPMIKR